MRAGEECDVCSVRPQSNTVEMSGTELLALSDWGTPSHNVSRVRRGAGSWGDQHPYVGEDSSFLLGSRVSVAFGTLSAHGFCACPVILGMGMTPVTDTKFTPTTECDE